MTIAERFWSKVDTGDNSGCWNWTASKGKDGYGQFGRGGSGNMISSHRFAYEFNRGDVVPKGLQLDHLCRNRGCVNPSHLEAVTQLVNISRSSVGQPQSRRTHCPKGHEYTAGNTGVHCGSKYCKACRRQYSEKYRLDGRRKSRRRVPA